MEFFQKLSEALGTLIVPVALGVFVLVLFLSFYYFGKGLQAAGEKAATAMGWVLFVLNWTFPPILATIAYVMPALHQKVGFVIPENARGAVIVLGLIGFSWLVFIQMLTANSPSTRLKELITDFLVSATWMLFFYGWAMRAHGVGNLEWWLALVAMFCTLDVVINTVIGFRNSFQKNPTQMQKGE